MKSARTETRILFLSGYSERAAMPLPDGLDLVDKPFTPQALVRRPRQIRESRRQTADAGLFSA